MYKICNYCVMDTSDPDIKFDINGTCNHCKNWFQNAKKIELGTKKGELERICEKIKSKNKSKYDCLIGVSGGVDSTYTAYLVKKLGLNPLAIHMDNGWNSELAVDNIKNTLEILDIDLYTEVLDWNEFKKLQVAFLKASTPDSEIPTDHAISAVINKIAIKNKIKYIFSGYNFANEGIMPRAWSKGHNDWRYIKDINSMHGNGGLKKFPHKSLIFNIYLKRIRRIKTIFPLNYIVYDKDEAMKTIMNKLKWRPYGGKHYESVYTRFYQGYILPTKFGYDKRRAHLSTLICNGNKTRNDALIELQNDPYPDKILLENDYEFVLKKMGLTMKDFENILNLPVKKFEDYKSYENSSLVKLLLFVTKKLRNKE